MSNFAGRRSELLVRRSQSSVTWILFALLALGLGSCGDENVGQDNDGLNTDGINQFDGNLMGEDVPVDAPEALTPDALPDVATCTTSDETCNGLDDDCDGETDEATCDDGNPCTTELCNAAAGSGLPGTCTATAVEGSCTDGNACTLGDSCSGGACVAGKAAECDDDNECTIDLCNSKTGSCDHPATPGSCDDGNACSVGEVCDGGVCSGGKTLDCSDKNPCTDDTCDNTGGCLHQDNSAACDDGDGCTLNDACAGGACLPGAASPCDDVNACTTDSCNLASGCTHTAVDGPGLPPMACEDGDGCTIGDTCTNGQCGGAAKDCDDGNSCTSDFCASGGCQHIAKVENAVCDDADPCTMGDVCDHDGKCTGKAFVCDDGNPCTSDVCTKADGKCHTEPTSGAACEDGSGCTLGDACVQGSCESGAVKVCNDANPCTDDSCDSGSGQCVFTANATPCSDNDACTVGDACAAGLCSAGTVTNCDDNDPCTYETCNNVTGKCNSGPVTDGVACSDGVACTQGDVCKTGKCIPGGPPKCDDGNVCTTDSCDPVSGKCVAKDTDGSVCDDGNPCTTKDACAAGKCLSGVNVCDCQTNLDCKSKEDGDLCNGSLYCDTSKPGAFACKVDLKTVVVCDTSKDTECVSWACKALSGKCEPSNKTDSTACDADKSVCTSGDHCLAGLCTPGLQAGCDDKNACTNDSCDPLKGCTYAANNLLCSDDNPCTLNDKCSGSACSPGAALPCDDGDTCTADYCDTNTGKCAAKPLSGGACTDGNACTLDDVCMVGLCQPANSKVCDDGNPCMQDLCDPANGACVTKAVPDKGSCEDGNPCTLSDACKTGKCLAGNPKSCDDGNVCTVDSCDSKTGACKAAPAQDGLTCSDGDSCTIADTCKGGGCVSGAQKVCKDSQCTTATCDPAIGTCQAKGNTLPCDDGNLCSTGETCSNGACLAAKFTLCGDGNPCTNDSCDASTGKCAFANNKSGCDDGNSCTKVDLCTSGSCVGAVVNCNDGNPCTTDSCDPASGCKHAATATQPCDDGNICTTADTCTNGSCKGKGVTCSDGNPCTSDACVPGKGCVFTATTGACSDGNACTVGDSCATSKCLPGKPSLCDDGKPCTEDLCNPGDGGCKYLLNDKNLCSDGNACSADDHCDAGACKGGAVLVNCDDKNPCTADQCNPAKGCEHIGNPAAPCTDDNLCTFVDVCLNGKCVSGEPTDCDDKNPCTSDTCAPNSGCKHANNTLPCDDGDACQGPDTCIGGKCVAAAQISCEDFNSCTVDACDKSKGCGHSPAASSASTSTVVGSDGSTLVSTEVAIENGQEVHVNFAPATAVTPDPKWATLPDSTWIWAKAAPPSGQNVQSRFTRSFSVGDSGKLDGTLTVAAYFAVTCWLNEKLVISAYSQGTSTNPATVSIKSAITTGANKLKCDVDYSADLATSPPGFNFRIEVIASKAGTPCDDGNPCTTGDSCFGGSCIGPSGPTCDDGNACTADSCTLSGGCSHSAADGALCDDGNQCTAKDKCLSGKCMAGSAADCDYGSTCVLSGCDPALGCTYKQTTTGKYTAASTVSSTATTYTAADGSEKPAALAWDSFPGWTHAIGQANWLWSSPEVTQPTQTQQAVFTQKFTITPGAVTYIGQLTIATDGAFVCMLNGVLVGVETDEGNYSKPLIIAISGAIKAGDNSLTCTVVNPGKAGASAFTNPAGLLFRIDISSFSAGASAPCQDGNACTNGDYCSQFECKPGPVVSCDDSNGCTADFCDPVTGCGHLANQTSLCDDGNPCTVSDVCKSGKCVGGATSNCEDGNPCTDDPCDAKGCSHVNADGKSCDDNNACTGQDTCKGGKCLALSGSPCDDGNPCTLDGCQSVSGCYHSVDNAASCNDGNLCTVGDLCAGGSCVGKAQNPCDDSDSCSADSCDPVNGCAHAALGEGPCEDGDSCTVGDICKSGACASGGLKACSDGEPCTVDGCDVKTGACKFTSQPNGPCEDGNLCTNNDACTGGKCAPGTPRDCSDTSPCTLDSCDPGTGNCVHTAGQNGAGCDDGDPCTGGDACALGKCLGQAKSCDDSNPCTTDTCDHTSGKCQIQVLSDGTACGGGAVCKAGICQ